MNSCGSNMLISYNSCLVMWRHFTSRHFKRVVLRVLQNEMKGLFAESIASELAEGSSVDFVAELSQFYQLQDSTGPAISDKLATAVDSAMRTHVSADKIKQLSDQYLRPKNCKNLTVPKDEISPVRAPTINLSLQQKILIVEEDADQMGTGLSSAVDAAINDDFSCNSQSPTKIGGGGRGGGDDSTNFEYSAMVPQTTVSCVRSVVHNVQNIKDYVSSTGPHHNASIEKAPLGSVSVISKALKKQIPTADSYR